MSYVEQETRRHRRNWPSYKAKLQDFRDNTRGTDEKLDALMDLAEAVINLSRDAPNSIPNQLDNLVYHSRHLVYSIVVKYESKGDLPDNLIPAVGKLHDILDDTKDSIDRIQRGDPKAIAGIHDLNMDFAYSKGLFQNFLDDQSGSKEITLLDNAKVPQIKEGSFLAVGGDRKVLKGGKILYTRRWQ